MIPKKVKLVEVSPRDGLQNEAKFVPTQTKLGLINRLAKTGLKHIEVTSFVSEKKIPQLADHNKIIKDISNNDDISYSVLIPNVYGLQDALAVGVRNIAIFGAASETFSQKNINCSIYESLQHFADVVAIASDNNIPVRAYLSCCLGCPYEGNISADIVANLAEKLFQLGCYEISLGDTIGVGTAASAQQLVNTVARKIPKECIAMHFHDTYGQALTNIYATLQLGIQTFDCSVSGLGGCPYAPGSTGNVATEDVVYLLNGLHIETGIDLDKLIEAGAFIDRHLNRRSESKVARVKR